jgi:2',3'-cyclic-nucleotide 2'-phosphodiesterase (5'-nucleotidase family)
MPNVIAALAGLLLAATAPVRPPADTTQIVLVATTDVHGRAMAWDYERDLEAPLGLVRAATVVDSLRRLYPGRVVLLDVGDLIQGNAFATYFTRVAPQPRHPILALMNRMGYDAATPGNHEFNFGLDVLQRTLRGALFPYVSANIISDATRRTVFPTSTVVVRAGVRIGITGVTTPGVMAWDGSLVRGRVHVAGIVRAGPAVLRGLKARSDVTVLLAHAGLRGSEYGAETGIPPENDVAALLAAAPETDVAILGHTHRQIADTTIGTTLVVEPRPLAQQVAVVHLAMVREGRQWTVARKWSEVVSLATERPDTALVAAFAAQHAAVRAWVQTPLGQVATALRAGGGRSQDTPLLDFVNEVMRRRAGAQLSATAVFDTAAALPAGPVRLGDLTRVYPYDNTLKAVRISGGDLRAYLEWSARYWRGMGSAGPIRNESVSGSDVDVVSGVEYRLDLAQPVGRRVVALSVGGRAVSDRDSFTLALNNYRAGGGGGYAMLARAPVVYDRGEDIRELLAAEIRQRGTIRAEDYFQRNWEITGAAAAAPPDSIILRVLETNDFHGALLPRTQSWSNGREVGGAAAIAAMMTRLAGEAGGAPTLRVDAGDMMQGTPISNLSFGRATVEVFNAMGYAASAIGNHEFDWTPDTMAARIQGARFLWLSANLRTTTGGRPAWARPWAMVRAGPLKVALIGYTTIVLASVTRPDYVADLRIDSGAAIVDSLVLVARRDSAADVVILLAHEGAFCDERRGCRGEVVDLAQALTQKPDLIVSGHTHSLVTTVVNGIPIIQARSSGTALGIADIVALPGGGRTVRLRVETVYADREQADTAVARVVDAYRRATDSLTTRAVATLADALTRYADQYPLGNLIADAYRTAARADVAVVNNGGIRSDLEAGTVTWGQLFQVLPFQNAVTRVVVNGAQLRAVLEHAAGSGDARAHVSGVRVTVVRAAPEGQRVAAITLADGRTVQDDGRYTLAVPDFMAAGGSGYAMLRPLPSTNTGVVDLDALVAYLRQLPQPVRVPAESRIVEQVPR